MFVCGCISEGKVRAKFPLGNISNRMREREKDNETHTHREGKREAERRRVVEKKKTDKGMGDTKRESYRR